MPTLHAAPPLQAQKRVTRIKNLELILQKIKTMFTRNIFTRRGQAMRAIFNAAGALALVAGLLALMLAYFDVLTK